LLSVTLYLLFALSNMNLFNIKPLVGASDIQSQSTLFGPYLRAQQKHLEENDILRNAFLPALGHMVDVGAHTGSSCLPFLDAGWKVTAFEPNPVNRQHLLNKLATRSADLRRRCTVNTAAIGASEREAADFFFSEESSGISGLSAFRDSHRKGDSVRVTTLKLSLKGQSVDYLKIDTEGHDLFALQGFPWDCSRPNVIQCEFEDSKTLPLGYSWQDMADYLVRLGYSVYVSEWHPIIRYGIRHDWRALHSYPATLLDRASWGNLLAFYKDPGRSAVAEAFALSLLGTSVGTFSDAPRFWKVEHKSCVTSTGGNTYSLRPPADTNYICFRYSGIFLPDATLKALMVVNTCQRANIHFSLLADSASVKEGSSARQLVYPGTSILVLKHSVKHIQKGFRLQIAADQPIDINIQHHSLADLDLLHTARFVPSDRLFEDVSRVNNAPNNSELSTSSNATSSCVESELPPCLTKLAFYLQAARLANNEESKAYIAAQLSVGLDDALHLLSSKDLISIKVLLTAISNALGTDLPVRVQFMADDLVHHGEIEGKFVKAILPATNKAHMLASSPAVSISGKYAVEFALEYSLENNTDSQHFFVVEDAATGRTIVKEPLGVGSYCIKEVKLPATSFERHQSLRMVCQCGGQNKISVFSMRMREVPESRGLVEVVGEVMNSAAQQETLPAPNILRAPTQEPMTMLDVERMASLHNKFSGQRIFIMGNGPSLNLLPLDKLSNDYVFGLNRVSLLFERVAWRPTFFTAFDTRVVPDNAAEFAALDIPYKFFSARYKALLGEQPNHYWHHVKGYYNGFEHCFDPEVLYSGFGGGGTIAIIAIEIAFYLGFDPIILIGTDVSYSVPTTVQQAGKDVFGDGVKLELTSTRNDDANHFDPRYFGAGKKWHNPNTRDMKIGFARAHAYMKRRGRSLLNATAGGNLNEVPRVAFAKLF
jgi:FkbM family methyltransferase